MKVRSFEPFAGTSAILVGLFLLLYAVAFIIVGRSAPALAVLLSSIFLLGAGLLSTAVLTALYERLREIDPPAALWALLLGVAGALGSAIHGGFDLANALQPPSASGLAVLGELPNAVDPRGLLTFAVAGLALFVISSLITRDRRFPAALGYLGYLDAFLLVVLYLGRLIILTPSSPIILVPAILNGFLVNPIWYGWLGLHLWRGPSSK